MKIKIIDLAKKKIKQRDIPIEWIKETLKNPEDIIEGHSGRKIAQRIYRKSNKDMLLRVIYTEEDEEIVVITSYLTSQIEKYRVQENED